MDRKHKIIASSVSVIPAAVADILILFEKGSNLCYGSRLGRCLYSGFQPSVVANRRAFQLHGLERQAAG